MALSRPARQDLNALYRQELYRDYAVHQQLDEDRILKTLFGLLWPEDGESTDYAYLGELIDKTTRWDWLNKDYKKASRGFEVQVSAVYGETGQRNLDTALEKATSQRELLRIEYSAEAKKITGKSHKPVLLDKATPQDYLNYGQQQYDRARPFIQDGDWFTAVNVLSRQQGADPNRSVTEQGILELEVPDLNGGIE